MVIDAHAYVVENEETWEHMEPGARRHRPQLVNLSDADPRPQAWVIPNLIGGSDGFVWPISPRDAVSSPEAREMRDVDARIKLMDQAGIDVQILHSTMFMRQVTARPEIDVPVCRAWNRWMAEVWSRGKGRLRWTCVPPLTNIPDALDEVRYAREHGAVGVMLRPTEGERVLVDPYFYPLYEEAQRLNMPIVIQISNGNAWYYDLYDSPYQSANTFGQFHMPAVVCCHQLTTSALPNLFPTLRWAIAGAGAQWLPWIIYEAQRRLTKGQKWPEQGFAAFRTYVTCGTQNDLPDILKHAGEDVLIIGTNYGQGDSSGDMDAIDVFRKTSGQEPRVINKILSDNPRALYGI